MKVNKKWFTESFNFSKFSIHSINKFLVISFVVINFAVVFYVLWNVRDDKWLNFLIWINVSINLLVLVTFFYINRRYSRDFEWLIDFFKRYLEEKENTQMPQNNFFIENKRIESLIKKAYIKWNLFKKDFNELKWIFEKFIPQDIYKKLGFRGYERVTLGSCISKNVTIMFLDIMWFTKMSEDISPEKALILLNIYFDWIGEIVYKRWWYIDKFLWDWIMMLFEQEDSDDAIMCAIEIQEFVKKFQISTIGKKINVWIGINSWEVIMWTIWTKKRMEATVIWDNVNIASRLQALTRKYNKWIIISEGTYNYIKDKSKFSTNRIGDEKISWKDNKVSIFSVEDYYKVDI